MTAPTAQVRDLPFTTRLVIRRTDESPGTVVAATAPLATLSGGDFVRVTAATGSLVPGFYLVTRAMRAHGAEVWLAWVAGSAAVDEVRDEHHPYALRVDSEHVCWFWDAAQAVSRTGSHTPLASPEDAEVPGWMRPSRSGAAETHDWPALARSDDGVVPVVLGPRVSSGARLPSARVLQALAPGVAGLPTLQWALARRSGAGAAPDGGLGPVVHEETRVDVFLPRRSVLRRRVREGPQHVLERIAGRPQTPDIVVTLLAGSGTERGSRDR